MENNKLTKEQVSEGLEKIAQWFPEEAESIKAHREAIFEHLLGGMSIHFVHSFINRSSKSVFAFFNLSFS